MGGRILGIRGPAMGVDFKLENGTEKACQGLAFRLVRERLEQELADSSWSPALVWDADARRWHEESSGAELTHLEIDRWGHVWPVPTTVTLQIHSPRGELLYEEECDGSFSFVPRSQAKSLRLRRRAPEGGYTQLAFLHVNEWQTLPSWPEAGGRRGTITFRTPLWQRRAWEAGQGLLPAAPTGPRQRLSPLAAS